MFSHPLSNQEPTTGIRLVLGYLFVFVAFVGGINLFPLIMIAFYPSEWTCFPAFLISGGSSLLIGALFAFLLLRKKAKGKLAKFQDSVLLVLIWIAAIVIAAMPYFLADKLDFFGANNGALSMNFSESFFEAMSGYCTVGYTVLHGFDSSGMPTASNFIDSSVSFCPHVFLFYRALTQFFGGVGLILVVASAVSDRFGMQLFTTEGHNDRLLPNLAKTAKATFGIYVAIIAVGAISMWLFGMDPFEALCHSISGMATGGFSTRLTSLYGYTNPNPVFGVVNNVGIEISNMVVMILGATSFLVLFNAVTLKWKNIVKDCEFRLMTIITTLSIIFGTVLVIYQYSDGVQEGLNFSTALRYASFQVVCCLTTTGFGNAPSVVALGEGMVLLSILLMTIGGGMGSTAGGMKQFRIALGLKSLWWSIIHKFTPGRLRYPRNMYRAGKTFEVTEDIYRENSLYIILYAMVMIVPALIIIALPRGVNGLHYTATESIYLVSSALSSAGNTVVDILGVRQGLHAAGASLWSYNLMLWILSVCMLLGRLEILPIYYAIRRMNRIILRRRV